VTLVFTLLTMVVLGLVAAVAVGRIGGGLDKPASSLPSRGLPAGDVVAQDLDEVRFSPALRGYRMDEVDAVMDRLAAELARRDDEIERMHALLTGHYGQQFEPQYQHDYEERFQQDYAQGYDQTLEQGYEQGYQPDDDVPTQTISRSDIG
jgi:DivIVA domain-containing protein